MLGSASDQRTHSPVGEVAWLYLVVLWLTWTPVGNDPPEILWLPPDSWVPFLGNLLLFAPMGLVLAVHRTATMHSSGRVQPQRLVGRVALTVAILCVAVELGQFRVTGRSPSPWDVALNTGGAAAAAWLGAHFVRSGVGVRSLAGAAMGVVFAGVLLFVIATGFTASRMLVLSDWNEYYVVFEGDEPSGDRAYAGDVSEARICAGPGDGEVCAGPGATPEERLALVRIAQDSQAVRLSAVATSAGPQHQDARIVTFSTDPLHRNATLYQDGRDLFLRLRTPVGGPNGTGLEFVLPDAIPDGVPTVVRGSFQTGRIEMTAGDGAVRAGFPIGALSGWWLVRPLPESRVDAGTLRLAMLVSAAAFSLPLGLGAVLVGWGPALLRVLGGGLIAPVLLFLLTSALQIPMAPLDAAAAAGFGVLGGALGLMGRSAPQSRGAG